MLDMFALLQSEVAQLPMNVLFRKMRTIKQKKNPAKKVG